MAVVDTNTNVSAHLDMLKSRGVTAVGRYYSSKAWKRLTRSEAAAISAAGISIFTVFENDGDPDLTRDSGLNHGQIAAAQARDVGQPAGSAIYFALEHLPSGYKSRHVDGIKDYIAGVRDGLDGRYEVGVYSDGVVCQALLAAGIVEYTWLSASMSFEGSRDFLASNRWSIAQVMADGRPKIDLHWDGVSIDLNQARADFGQFKVSAHAAVSITSVRTADAGGEDADEDPAAPHQDELSDTADLDTARMFANSGDQWSAASDLAETLALSLSSEAGGMGAFSAGGVAEDGRLDGFDLDRAKQFLDACMTSHPRVTYGLGAKVPFFRAVPGRDFTKIDCSGFVREAIRLSTNPRVPFPDGSVVQHDWVKAHGFEHATVADGAKDDGVVRIAFLSPNDSPSHIGHVLLLHAGRTLESHGGTGPDSRKWTDLGFRTKMKVYMLSRGAQVAAFLSFTAAPSASVASVAIVATAASAVSANFAVRSGHRYAATIVLRGLESFASNGVVAAKFTELGFTDVVATGFGGTRLAEGTWGGADAIVPLDPRLRDIVELSSGATDTAPLASPATIGRAVQADQNAGLPPSVFSSGGLPAYHNDMLVVETRNDPNLAGPPGTPLRMAGFAAFEPSTPGLSALNFLDRAGLIRRITPLRAETQLALDSGIASLNAGQRVMAASAFAPTGRRGRGARAAAKPASGQGTSFVEFEPGQNIEQLRRELASDPNVVSVSAVPTRYLAARDPQSASSAGEASSQAAAPGALPTWNLRKILWSQARARAEYKDADAIRVAVLDTGVDSNHPDLKVHSYHWQNSDISEPVSDKDIVGHGTHVSGTIAALVNGPDSVDGICRCSLSVWKIFGDTPTFAAGSYHYFVHPVLYRRALAALVDDPVDVINLSIGGPGVPDHQEKQLFQDLIDAGVTIVAAMGNDRQNGSPTSYPAALPGVIAVGATGRNDEVTVFSNSGNHISVSAPGKAIWSTLPTYPGQTGFSAVAGPDGRPRQGKPQRREVNYDAWDGTSMASPHIAACAALLIAKSGTNGLTPAQVRDAIMQKSDKVPGMGGADFTPDYGAGRINLDSLLHS